MVLSVAWTKNVDLEDNVTRKLCILRKWFLAGELYPLPTLTFVMLPAVLCYHLLQPAGGVHSGVALQGERETETAATEPDSALAAAAAVQNCDFCMLCPWALSSLTDWLLIVAWHSNLLPLLSCFSLSPDSLQIGEGPRMPLACLFLKTHGFCLSLIYETSYSATNGNLYQFTCFSCKLYPQCLFMQHCLPVSTHNLEQLHFEWRKQKWKPSLVAILHCQELEFNYHALTVSLELVFLDENFVRWWLNSLFRITIIETLVIGEIWVNQKRKASSLGIPIKFFRESSRINRAFSFPLTGVVKS